MKKTETSAEQRSREAVDRVFAGELARRAKAEGVELTGPGGLLQRLTKQVLESGLEVEMGEHLGWCATRRWLTLQRWDTAGGGSS